MTFQVFAPDAKKDGGVDYENRTAWQAHGVALLTIAKACVRASKRLHRLGDPRTTNEFLEFAKVCREQHELAMKRADYLLKQKARRAAEKTTPEQR